MKKFDANFVYLNGGGGGIAIVNYLIAYVKEGTLLQYNSLTFKVLDEWYSLSSFGQINFYPCIELG